MLKQEDHTAQLLTDKDYLLQKFAGKGGWTYALIPEIAQRRDSLFGWVRVRGSIDGYAIKNYHLMPMGNGNLFLPVKAAIRKSIQKEAGDTVRVVLYADDLPTEIPEELRLCLQDEPEALAAFSSYSNSEQKAFIDWIYSAKTEETRVQRIVSTIEKVMRGEKLLKKKGVNL